MDKKMTKKMTRKLALQDKDVPARKAASVRGGILFCATGTHYKKVTL